jgi:hypothetical protein
MDMKKMLAMFALVLVCGAAAANAQAPVCDYFSTSSTKAGEALAAGAIIEAFDSDGIRCGYAEAMTGGAFLMHVYGNDPMTPAVDEGAREGEMLTWKVDGITITPENAQWIANLVGLFADMRFENGAAKEIRLDAETSAIESTSWSEVKGSFRP